MKKIANKNKIKLENGAKIATQWIGSTESLAVHTFAFVLSFLIPFIGIITFEHMLLVLTTVLSLEAIYLAIFIQMSVNKNTADIEDIAEDVEEIQEDVDEIQKDVDEIQEDIEDFEEDEIKEDKKEKKEQQILLTIQDTLKKLTKEIENLKK